jgi:hypothetical protein
MDTSQSVGLQFVEGKGNIVAGRDLVINKSVSPADEAEQRNLAILRGKVSKFWIEGVLGRSVHGEALLALGKKTLPDAVINQLGRALVRTDKAEMLPSDRKMGAVFNDVDGFLLILGEPGSGKTTTMLELARDLLEPGEDDSDAPVPVVFNLSSWSVKRQSLFDWLVDELKTIYRIPKPVSRSCLNNGRLIPLLDGLDEVAEENRLACLNAINELLGEKSEVGVPGLVVCSRRKEYVSLPVRLTLTGAIYLLPLKPDQVDEHLAKGDSRLSALRTAIKEDVDLQKLAESPLMLSIMSMAYQDSTPELLAGEELLGAEARRKHVFDCYIGRMFERKGTAGPYERASTEKWLSWLAHQMNKHSQSMFLIENLQPGWLPTRRARWAYGLTSRAVIGIAWGLAISLPIWLINRKIPDPNYFLEMGLGWGLFAGIAAGLIDSIRLSRAVQPSVSQERVVFLKSIFSVLVYVAVGGLVAGLVAWVVGVGHIDDDDLDHVSTAVVCVLSFGLVFGLRRRRPAISDIQTVGSLSWSFSSARKGLVKGLLGGLTEGLLVLVGLALIVGAVSLAVTLREPNVHLPEVVFVAVFLMMLFLIIGLALLVIGGALGSAIGTIFSGLSGRTLQAASLDNGKSNQGIRRSARNGIVGGLLMGIPGGLVAGAISCAIQKRGGGAVHWDSTLRAISFVGLALAIPSSLWYGMADVIQHYTLRSILALKHYTPRQHARFLDYAVRLIFLQKVGCGYIFIHRLLLEHFAELHETGAAQGPGQAVESRAGNQPVAR